MYDIFKDLNEEQAAAVKATEGYVRVIAGAGSGKTKTLVNRFVYLVTELGIAPNKILCITFTNKAAGEMRYRLRRLLNTDADISYINTYHGFCHLVLQDDIVKINYPQNFSILDGEDQKLILRDIYNEMNLSVKDFTYKKILDDIGAFKDSHRHQYPQWLADPELQTICRGITDAVDKKQEVIFRYLYKQRKTFGVDFDDLPYITLNIFQNFPDVLAKWQDKLQYIEVDEFQDVDEPDYELVRLLSQKHQNLFIVGDPDQTIYSWRGARINYILDFDQAFPAVKTIYLNKNYRSTPEILEATNSLIKNNHHRLDKALVPIKSSNMLPIYFHAKTSRDEAEWIANNIRKLTEYGISLNDIAILYRAHYLSRPLEECLIRKNIKYIIYNGTDFYSRAEIKDALAYLHMVHRDDNVAFLRIINTPSRNIGKTRIALLTQYSETHNLSLYQALQANLQHPMFINSKAQEFVTAIEETRQMVGKEKISNILDEVLKRSNYKTMYMTNGDTERLDNIAELINSIVIYEEALGEETSLGNYLNEIALFADKDRKKQEGCVKLMSVHTAKGLEFKYVFVCGLNEGIFPSRKTTTKEAMEEERRLAYVAFTRAENCLYLSEAEGINFDNSFRYPSRFLFNIDKTLINYENEADIDQEILQQAQEYIAATEQKLNHPTGILQVGDRVQHKAFGQGTIQQVDTLQQNYLIQFDNFNSERNIQFDFVTKI